MLYNFPHSMGSENLILTTFQKKKKYIFLRGVGGGEAAVGRRCFSAKPIACKNQDFFKKKNKSCCGTRGLQIASTWLG